MNRTKILCLLMAAVCIFAMQVQAAAAEVECDAVYCFSTEDFGNADTLTGICITGLPETGTVKLGSRILRPGDVLPTDRLGSLRYYPLKSEEDVLAELTYLPICADGVESVAVMSIAVAGKTDQAPVAEDSAMETYRNLPNEALLQVKDPEGQTMTYTVTRLPKRGEVVIRPDGSFVYTPKKNKTGVDSFAYTATDTAGNVSREATVTVTVLKPSDGKQYTDTVGEKCRFAAEWMKNTGIFVGENVNGNGCFQPEKEVSRGDFLTMLVGALEIGVEEEAQITGFTDEAPAWLKPYLAAAMRSGLTAGWPEGDSFKADEPITGAEAAVMLQNALDLRGETASADESVPAWAQQAVATLGAYGIELCAGEALTRGQAAQILYQVSRLKGQAPGMMALRKMG